MNERDKLIELLHKGVRCPGVVGTCYDCHYQSSETPCDEFGATADMLIANGVTFGAVDPESLRPHGHWVEYDCYIGNSRGKAISKTGTVWVCSECGREEPRREPYCHCGAIMDLKEET